MVGGRGEAATAQSPTPQRGAVVGKGEHPRRNHTVTPPPPDMKPPNLIVEDEQQEKTEAITRACTAVTLHLFPFPINRRDTFGDS